MPNTIYLSVVNIYLYMHIYIHILLSCATCSPSASVELSGMAMESDIYVLLYIRIRRMNGMEYIIYLYMINYIYI